MHGATFVRAGETHHRVITFFTIPKPFRGHEAIIQTNAIRSWHRLRPACEVILFGDEEGIAEAAAEHGVRHELRLVRNEHGTPKLDSTFDRAQDLATHQVMCYINGDIILTGGVLEAVRRVQATTDRYLIVGRRCNLDVTELIDFNAPDWESRLVATMRAQGEMAPHNNIDYFIFPKGQFRHVLKPFLVGRPYWDNWMLWKARDIGARLIDATPSITAIHQNHGGRSWHIKGTLHNDEGNDNYRLLGSGLHGYAINNATHFLEPTGLRVRKGYQLDQARMITRKLWERLRTFDLRSPAARQASA